MRPIHSIADALGLQADAVVPYGKLIAKVPLESFPKSSNPGKLIVMTAITPTPLGEGKTVTAIGLVDGLARLNKKACLTLRQPSMAPVFGSKGGGAGGGLSTVVPGDQMNLHFTGDFHAVAAAHNLLAAIADSAVYFQQINGLESNGLVWNRVYSVEDRSLRSVITSSDRDERLRRATRFDIEAASEIMAILALSQDYEDLRSRLQRIVIGFTRSGEPVTARQVGAVGSMMALLRDAMMPNLAQTAEGQPAIVHTGPFGNIAHGCSSILADKLALAASEYVVTEAGFGADLGLEKFVHIKTRISGIAPSAAVVVVTTRALKLHGGVPMKEVASPNVSALIAGSVNLSNAIGIVRKFGIPAVVAINRFPDDTQDEITAIKRCADESGARAAVESFAFSQGGAGVTELAEAVVNYCGGDASVSYLYPLKSTIADKVDAIAREVYQASSVEWSDAAVKNRDLFTSCGWDGLPVCVAKTHLSLSADPKLKGVPKGHVLPVSDIRISAGAGFVYLLAGDINTMPALPRNANFLKIDVDENHNITGIR